MDPHVSILDNGWTHTEALHRPGVPGLLWRMLHAWGYTKPPSYVGRGYSDVWGCSCTVHMCIPPKLTYSYIDAWSVTAQGFHLFETWDTAALKALTTFFENNSGVPGTPFGLLPVREPENNPAWRLHMSLV